MANDLNSKPPGSHLTLLLSFPAEETDLRGRQSKAWNDRHEPGVDQLLEKLQPSSAPDYIKVIGPKSFLLAEERGNSLGTITFVAYVVLVYTMLGLQ